jgi:hypothetical protein
MPESDHARRHEAGAQNLRKDPQRLSEFVVSPAGDTLQVQAGESVKTGAEPSQDETTDNRTITWVFVEATNGLFVDLRKGFVSDGALVSTDVPVQASGAFQAFLEQVKRESFAQACCLQALTSRPSRLISMHWPLP